jgi:beta-lactamase superfamily II metal-dependent hydrolase
MYNVGFGDAFLVLLPMPGGVRKILFDCGSVASGGASIDAVANRIIADSTDADGKSRIDVVVCTHRHKDHVSGFAAKAWSRVSVGEVWMPWTEDPDDPDARRIRDTQSRLAAALDGAVRMRLAARGLSATERGRWQMALMLADNALSNVSAMETLHRGFAGDPVRRFLPGKSDPARLVIPALAGVATWIMGPSRDPDVIRDMDPPANRQWLAALQAGTAGDGLPHPFRAEWRVTPRRFRYSHLALRAADRAAVDAAGAELDPAVATSLDQAVNGTSLMLMLQVGKANLLFPGDAQWGTWQSALANPVFVELFRRMTFYKIGHHGSHNATPKDFVEQVAGRDFWAMASTRKMANWPQIPKSELLEGLAKRTRRIARSDEAAKAPKSSFVVEDGVIEARVPM